MSTAPSRILALALASACSPAQEPAPKAAAQEPSDFARFVPVGADEGRFETAITTYRDAQGRTVSLVAAVHIADARHYAELQAAFEPFDVLLYELIADPEDRPRPGEERNTSGPISMLQTLLKNGLELEFQLSAIDYAKDNFVHADLTPKAFSDKMRERGDNLVTLLLKEIGHQMQAVREMAAKQEQEREEREARGEPEPKQPEFDLVKAFQRGEGRHVMRLMFARQLEQVEAMMAGGREGEGSLILDERNDRAVEVLREQLEDGRKAIGIYYGAAHMPGIEKALRAMGFAKDSERWLVAWDIKKRADPKPKRAGK